MTSFSKLKSHFNLRRHILRNKISRSQKLQLGIFFATLFIYLLFTFKSDHTRIFLIEGHNFLFLTGDEPHYIFVVKNIVEEKSLFLEKTYVSIDWPFHDWHAKLGPSGHYFSQHGIGLPLLLVPFYFLGGVFGCMVFLNILGALVNVFIFKISERMIQNQLISAITCFVFGFASLLLPFSNQIFPEVATAFITLFITYGVLFKKYDPKNLLITGLFTGFLPFLKSSNLAILAVVFLFVLLRSIQQMRAKNFLFFFLPIFIWGNFLAYYQWYAFGNPLHTPVAFEIGNPFNGALGLLIDREYGLFVYAPELFLSIFGIHGFFKANKFHASYVLGLFLSLYFTFSCWLVWWGGFSYPARYLIPVLPLLSIPFSYALIEYAKKYWFKILFITTTSLGLIINVLITYYRGLGLSGNFVPYIKATMGVNLLLLPSFRTGLRPYDWGTIAIFLFAIFLILTYTWNIRIKQIWRWITSTISPFEEEPKEMVTKEKPTGKELTKLNIWTKKVIKYFKRAIKEKEKMF